MNKPPMPEKLNTLRITVLLLAQVFYSFFCLAQTPISNIVNTYYRVVEVIPAKSCVRLNQTTGLFYGDKIMLAQMKGASINTTTGASFGDTTSLNNAGNYEINTICSVAGDTAFLVHALLNNYTVTAKTQLVRIPQYYSANVTGNLKAAPWNNTTGTGGVLAIWVDEDLNLNAPISADSSGFRGGNFLLCNGGCSNTLDANAYAYDASIINVALGQRGAYKGEGIVDLAAGLTGGRGAAANGGGGGNNHNNSGAGGANLNAGGDGGGNSSSAGCNEAYVGKGGKALSNYGGKKIFMGGGGGAGHSNNGTAATVGGGHGGGIIFIHANNLIGNNLSITANGQAGGNSIGDGASGAGAGGTLILDVNNYIGALTVSGNGGNGGISNDGGTLNRCYGGGGGGSGGAIYFSGTNPAITYSTTAGTAGAETGRAGTCSAPVVALAGTNGQNFSNYLYRQSPSLANYCSLILPVELLFFKGVLENEKINLSWQITDPSGIDHFVVERSSSQNQWINVAHQPADEKLSQYHVTDPDPQEGYNYYRLLIVKKNKSTSYSIVVKILVATKNSNINIYPNPATTTISLTGLPYPAELKLYDWSAKLCWQKKIFNRTGSMGIQLPTLNPGVYILRVNDQVKKLIIR